MIDSEIRIVKTACPHDCPDTCSMLATVQGGKLLSVAGNSRNAYTRGNLCRKVAHYEERVYSPDRLLYPMRRTGEKGEGKFARIGWDEAIAEIAGNWKRIIRESGPEAILPYSYAGTMGVVNMSACDSRLWNRMGATQLQRTICSAGAEVGYGYVNGWSGGMDPEEFAKSRFIIAWGTNLSSTTVHLMPFIREAQQNGATFVVIDPYRTRTANAADWFVQPKPGTDAALALGLANVIFEESLHDVAFLEGQTIGWRAFRERCAQFPPERVAQITGLEVDEIVRLARAYATQTPAAIRLGYGISRNGNGGSMVRAISCLPAVIGAWGKPGSGLLLSTSAYFQLNNRSVKRPDLLHSPDDESERKWGRSVPRSVNMVELGKVLNEIAAPPIQSLYVFNSNPAAVAPNSNRVLEGLRRTDLFMVVHEQMMTDTARYADILLPATTQLEHLDLITPYGHLYINLCQPAIAPLGESLPNIEVMNALAKAMGYTDSVFDETAEDIIRGALQSDDPYLQGITYEQLLEDGFARLNLPEAREFSGSSSGSGQSQSAERGEYRTAVHRLASMEGKQAGRSHNASCLLPQHFRTLSGKIELWSDQAEADGFDALPTYEPPAESSEADPELAQEFPIILMTPAAHHFLNSTFSNLPSMQKGEKEPRIWIHPDDAALRQVQDGDLLRVWNRRGSIHLRAVVGNKVRPGTAWSPSLWWQRDSASGNVNHLTSDRTADMGGGSTFHTNLVQFARSE